MSCSDLEELKKEKSSESEDMGEVLGKESDETETEGNTVQLMQDINTIVAREDADGAPSSDELTIEPNSSNNAMGVGEPEHIEMLKEEPCSCDACKERRLQAAENLEEMRRLQADWMELRQYIRMVYRTAMEGNRPQLDHQSNIKELVSKLCTNDPHQLFQRLETQVQEFVIEAKVRQLELLKTVNSNNLPAAFISALLDNYKKLMTAADHLVPLLERLQNEHLNKFNISWKLLNQHLFQSFVYTEPLVQNNVPTFISQLGNTLAERADTYKKLVREFLSFDDEITLVMGMWRDGEARIHQYNEEQATLKLQQNILKKDWEEFKAHRKLLQKKMWHETASNGEVGSSPPSGGACSNRGCMCDECTMSQLLSTCGGLVTPPCSPASGSALALSNHMESERVEGEGHEAAGEPATCECHVCTAPPVPTSVELESSGVLNLHGGGFHLYPHIHGTGGHRPHNIGGDAVAGVYPHLYNLHTSLLANKHAQPPEPTVIMPVLPDHKPQMSDCKNHVPRPATPPPPPPKRPEHQRSLLKKPGASVVKGASSAVVATNHVHRAGPAPPTRPAFTNPAAAHRHSTTQTVAAPNSLAHSRLHPGTVGGDTTGGGGKAVAGGGSCSGGASSHMCHKHGGGEPIKRVPCGGCTGGGEEEETSSQEEGDSCSERSTSTQRGGGGGDSRHCDCCYCEVFGHGVPSVAPVSRNFQEMRERLRQLLTKKKAKCKTGATASSASAPAATASTTNPTAAYNPAFPTTDTPLPAAGDAVSPQPKDTRALEDLLQFIEGNPNAKCKDEKKAAKKARQKQKKQEELDRKRREEEEEERRQEELRKEEEKRAAALLKVQQQQQAAALAARQKEKKRAKKGQQQGGKGGSRGVGGDKHQHEQAQQQAVVEGGPQMVTIKRVMEPDSAEPTVTITLRGATPREDKVLYTLLNGQVCKVPKEVKNHAKGKMPQHQHQAPALAQSIQQSKNSGKNKNGSSGGNQQQAVSVHLVQNGNYQHHHNISVAASSQHNAKKANIGVSVSIAKGAKKENQRPPVSTVPPPPPQPTQQHGFVPKRVQAPPPSQFTRPPAPQPQLTSSAAIQINNAINKLSVRAPNTVNNNNNFNLNNLKLPPGITITKVDPSTVQRKPIQVKQSTPPAQSTAAPPMSVPSNVIVVDTGRYKTETSYSSNNKDQLDDGKKKKKKKSPVTNGGIFNGNGVGMPMGNGNLLSMVGGAKPLSRAGHPPPPQNGKVVMPQAAIIKLNGSMVTIRSPALQQALATTDPQTDAKKKKKKKKGPNGQGQPDEWNHLDESVFAPKDIDLENGDIDDAELEIEAFKRFCLQSVPPKRKEKVHFNIKDIVLKKKASAISCS